MRGMGGVCAWVRLAGGGEGGGGEESLNSQLGCSAPCHKTVLSHSIYLTVLPDVLYDIP